MKVLKRIAFWSLALVVMSFIYQSLLGSFEAAMILAILLLPGAALMSVGLSYWQRSRSPWRWLHLFYLLLFSLYLEWMAMVGAYWLIFEMNFKAVPTVLVNPFFLWLYMLAFAFAEEKLFRVKRTGTSAEPGPIWLEITSERKKMKIDLNKLFFVESRNEQIFFHFEDQVLPSRERIGQLQGRLPETFLRIHRSFIINPQRAESMANDQVQILGFELPVSRSYRDKISAYQSSQA